MAAPSYAKMKASNRQRWDSAVLHSKWLAPARKAASAIMAGRQRYELIESGTGVPWFVIGVKHMREANNDFRGVLHNGQKIVGTGRKTTIVPKGKGPFATWEQAAFDAIRYMKLDQIKEWPIERILYECERFNGFGYAFKGLPSPYIWSGTDIYQRGKYVRDGVFDPNVVDSQLGCAIVLKVLEQMGVQVDRAAVPVAVANAEEPGGEVSAHDGVDPNAGYVPEPEPITTPFLAGHNRLTPQQIEQIQRALFERGFTVVGLHDGRYGIDTDAALRQFLTVNGIDAATFVLSPGYEAAILAGKPKPVAPERANPEAQVLNERVPGHKEGWWAKITGGVMSILIAIGSFLSDLSETAQQYLSQFGSFLYAVSWRGWAIAGIIVFAAVMLIGRRVEKKGEEAFRKGHSR